MEPEVGDLVFYMDGQGKTWKGAITRVDDDRVGVVDIALHREEHLHKPGSRAAFAHATATGRPLPVHVYIHGGVTSIPRANTPADRSAGHWWFPDAQEAAP